MSFFKRKRLSSPSGETGASSVTVNPYMNAQRTWNSHVGSLIASRLVWQLIGIVSLLIVLASVAGIIYIGSQSKFVPYVVEVNKLGEVSAQSAIERASTVDSRIIKESVSSFIIDARLVTPDIALQRRAIFKVYSMLTRGSAASKKITEFLNGNPKMNPFKRAETETVNVEINSIIPLTANTWQVDWTETARSRKTGIALDKPYRMRALVTVVVRPDVSGSTEEQMQANPFGIYVSDYAWSKQE
jgi:type IV secretion system protein TrbF